MRFVIPPAVFLGILIVNFKVGADTPMSGGDPTTDDIDGDGVVAIDDCDDNNPDVTPAPPRSVTARTTTVTAP
jgi:hypothetical protein